MPPAHPELLFPYMHWAHREAFASPYCLSQSALPQPDMDLLGSLTGTDLLGYPSAEAQPALESRLAELFGVAPERVIATPGASTAMLLCAMLWFRCGARVLVDRPSYEPFRRLPELFGATQVELRRKLERGWTLDPEEVEGAVRAEPGRPTHLFLTNPNNPTGAVLDAESILALGRASAASGGVFVSCEVYMEYAQPAERVHAALLCPRAVTIGSLSKAQGLSPLRVGWIVLGEELADQRRRLVDMGYLAYVDPPTPSLVAGRRALDVMPDLLQPLRRIEVESRPHLWRWLEESAAVSAFLPPFGIFAFPRLEAVADTSAFARHLAAAHGVDVVPGEYFGLPGHVRVGCAVPEGTLVEGLARLTAGLQGWHSGSGPASNPTLAGGRPSR
jgi:aspartate/methionine/tyrosine aminotransferase